jgi:transposase
MAAIWAGIDAGKTHHHCVAIDEGGRRLLSRRAANDEPELLELLADVLALGDEVTWGIDLADGGAALAIAILLNHDQPVLYLSGRAIHRASEGYRGEGKTDAKDAAVIADQARIRRDLHPLRAGDETVTDLKILTGRRMDLVADRTRTVNRLRAQLTGIFPGLERALDLTNTGPAHLANRLPNAGCPPPDRPQEAGNVAAQPQGPPRRPAGRDSLPGRRAPAHQPPWREADRPDGPHAGGGGDGSQPAGRRDRQAH